MVHDGLFHRVGGWDVGTGRMRWRGQLEQQHDDDAYTTNSECKQLDDTDEPGGSAG